MSECRTDPLPLPELFESVAEFDPALLPESLRPWIDDIAERIQCPMDFPAVSAMTALAAVLGRRIGIRPHQRNDWLVVPNLWAGVVGRPGIMKSAAIGEPLKPLKRLEIDAKQRHDAALVEYKAAAMVREQQAKLNQAEIKSALKKDPEHARAIARQQMESEEQPPARTRYLVNDCTVEKMGEILNQNPDGHILSYRDELVGLLKGLDKTGQEQARSFYLEAWNGDGRFTYDRIGRGTIDIEAAICCIIGSIQPGPLETYLAGNQKAAADDGLIQRFQLLVWPNISKDWNLVDEWPDRDARDRAHQVYFNLAGLNPVEIDANMGETEIPHLRFDAEAQERFNDWQAPLERIVRSDEEHPAMASHLAKYRSLIPSLALLDHLAEGRHGRVILSSVERAIAWGQYLESHARRVYGSTINEKIKAAHELAKRIQTGKVSQSFTARDIYRHGWSGLSDRTDVEMAADVLVDLNWLTEDLVHTAGRPKKLYYCHPAVMPEPDKT